MCVFIDGVNVKHRLVMNYIDIIVCGHIIGTLTTCILSSTVNETLSLNLNNYFRFRSIHLFGIDVCSEAI